MCDKCQGKGYIESVEFVEHFGGAYRMPVQVTCERIENDECPECGDNLYDWNETGTALLILVISVITWQVIQWSMEVIP